MSSVKLSALLCIALLTSVSGVAAQAAPETPSEESVAGPVGAVMSVSGPGAAVDPAVDSVRAAIPALTLSAASSFLSPVGLKCANAPS